MRKFVFTGDGGYGTQALAQFASRQPRLTLVSKFSHDANPAAAPPKRRPGIKGRPPLKGHKRPSPQEAVEKTQRRQRLGVSWHGGGRRCVSVVTGVGRWRRSGAGLVPVRWVLVADLTGTHRDECFFTTDVDMSAKQVIEAYTGRWAIEVMFEEVREHVGLETTRGRCASTILRAAPCLFGLDRLVALWFSELPATARPVPIVDWTGSVKKTLTFSDAITLARQQVWRIWVLESPGHALAFQKLNPRQKDSLLDIITQAL